MKHRTAVLTPYMERCLQELGENIKLARLRRRLTMKLVCERAFISRTTLTKIEKGDPSVSMGCYVVALHAVGNFEKELSKIAREDEWGRTIVDMGLTVPKRGGR